MAALHSAITMRQLIYFVAVAEAKSFRQAAEKLNMSQPPLTQQIQALERTLETTLFDRSKRRIELTEAGSELLADSRNIITIMNRTFSRTQAIGRGLTGRLKIGMTDDFVFSPVFDKLVAFSLANQGIIIETYVEMSTTLSLELSQNTLDIVLTNRLGGLWEGAIVEQYLPPSRIMALMHRSHPLASRTSLVPTDLEGEPLIHVPDDSRLPFARECAQMFHEAKVTPLVAHHTTNASVAARLAAEGLGIALVSEYSISPVLGELVLLPIKARARLEHVLLYQDRKLSPAMERLVEALLVTAE